MEKNKEKTVKTLSKILYVVSKILKVMTRIAIGFVVFAMLVVPVAIKSISIKDDKLVINDEYVKNNKTLTIKAGDLVIMDAKDENYTVLKDIFNKNSKTSLIIYSEVFMLFIIAILVITSFIMDHLYKFFKNIYEGNTFALENVSHLKMVSNYMIATLLISWVASLLSEILFNQDTFTTNAYGVFEIMFVYLLAYVFEYGYEIQKKSKKTMFTK